MARPTSTTDTFEQDGAGQALRARAGDEFAFSVTGRFTGLVILEQWCQGGPRRRLQLDAPAQGRFVVAPMDEDDKTIHFRWRMDGHARGHAVATLTDDLGLVA